MAEVPVSLLGNAAKPSQLLLQSPDATVISPGRFSHEGCEQERDLVQHPPCDVADDPQDAIEIVCLFLLLMLTCNQFFRMFGRDRELRQLSIFIDS